MTDPEISRSRLNPAPLIAGKCLLSIVIVIAAVQFYQQHTTLLSPWKGGGFGMYTAPHAQFYRTTWLLPPSGDLATARRLWPVDGEVLKLTNQAADNLQIKRILYSARDVRYFPTPAKLGDLLRSIVEADELLELVEPIDTGGAKIDNRKSLSLAIFQSEVSLSSMSVRNVKITEFDEVSRTQ